MPGGLKFSTCANYISYLLKCFIIFKINKLDAQKTEECKKECQNSAKNDNKDEFCKQSKNLSAKPCTEEAGTMMLSKSIVILTDLCCKKFEPAIKRSKTFSELGFESDQKPIPVSKTKSLEVIFKISN